MATIIRTADLRRALAVLQRVIERKNLIPILGMVRVKASADAVTITATDLDIEVVCRVACDRTDDLDVVLSPHILSVVSRWGDTITLEPDLKDQEVIVIRSDDATMRVRKVCLPQDFPEFSWEETGAATVSEAALRLALRRVTFAMSTEETRYYLNGVFFDRRDADGLTRLVATDGHRLGCYTMPDLKWMDGHLADTIWPRKTIEVLASVLKPGGNNEVRLCWHGQMKKATRAIQHPLCGFSFEHDPDKPDFYHVTYVAAHVGDVTIRSKLIDGTFPDWRRVVPKLPAADDDDENSIDIALTPAIWSRLQGFINGESKAIQIDPEAGVIRAKSSFLSTDIEVRTGKGKGAAIVLNANYLRRVMDGRPMRLRSKSSGDPAVLTSEDAAEFAVIMPMRW